MRSSLILSGVALSALGLVASGCSGGSSGGGGTAAPATANPNPTTPPANPTPAPISSAAWPHLTSLNLVEAGTFATSPLCARCHSNDPRATAMRDSAGRGVAAYDMWRASMMANATRDPLWRAQVEVEIAATPSMAKAIESKCMSCHAPMADRDAKASGEQLELSLLSQNTDRAHLALDGVSCTSCHQIQPTNDVSATFGGNFLIGTQREIYGPYDNPLGSPMATRTNFVPMKGDHIRKSASCASCHTLYTSAVRSDGTPTGGRIAEQTPYLEWQNSVYNDEVATPGPFAANCSSCHAPSTDLDGNAISTKIARDGELDFPIPDRSPYGRHVFLGGNTLVPAILRDNAADLKPSAPGSAFDAIISETRTQLRQKTADVSLGAITRTGGMLSIPVTVTNKTGHKFPTGHPIRRAWLRVVVKDAQGNAVFSSGGYDSAGRIVDGAGKVLASEAAQGPTQPHRTKVTSSDQVQIYQSLMKDESGAVTFLLLRGEGYAKDNRLLPLGWSPNHPTAKDTAPQGLNGDADFNAGRDQLTYEVQAPSASGPYSVEVTLLYQPCSSRYAEELFQYSTPGVAAFKAYYQKADRRPELVAQATATTP